MSETMVNAPRTSFRTPAGVGWFGVVMPRYFFDIDDGKRQVRDQLGMDLPSEDSAMKEASALLHTLAQIRNIERRSGTTIVRVRDDDGEEIYEGSARIED